MKHRTRVLVVDDQVEIRSAVAELLGECDTIEVVGVATNGAEALDALANIQTDAVLMDLRMPVMDGLEATRRITEAGIETAVLIHSAYGDNSFVLEALQAGARGYVVKGSAVSDIVSALTTVANGKSHISDEVMRPLVDRLVDALAVERQTRQAAQHAAEKLAALTARQHEFAIQAAHELRTPLTGMLGALELLVDDDLDAVTAHRLCATALSSAHRLRRLTQNLEVTAEGDAFALRYELVDVRAVVEDVVQAMDASDVVRCDISDGLLVWSDCRRFQLVIDNLVSNAITASPKGSPVDVRARRDGDVIRIDVSDDGRGFSDGALATMFQPFADREDAASGLGIGMYVVGEVARSLDATVTPVNNDSGGATVHLAFAGNGSR
jgi:signal transduction histidine kinase